ncbi:MAG TPA: PadR family transcriptional regulator [Ktedonobacteraceae bacterium]
MVQQQQFFVSEQVRRLPWLLLAALEPGPQPAALLLSLIEQQTGEFCEPGTFYRWMALAERQGWMERVAGENPLALYRLTVAGIAALDRQRAQSLQPSGVKENIMRFVTWIVRLYPPAWRERYEEEMRALLELHTITLFTVIDLFFGAFHAWLDPHYRRTNPRLLRWRIHSAGVLLSVSLGTCFFAAMGWIQVSDINTPADLDRLATTLSPLAYSVLAPLGMVGLAIAFCSLLILACTLIAQGWLSLREKLQGKKEPGKARKRGAPWWYILRLLPIALAVFLLSIPRTWIPSWLGINDWSFNGFLFVLLMDGAIEAAAYVLSKGKAWLERNGFPLAVVVSGAMVSVCAFNVIWTSAVWQLIPRMEAAHPTWQWQTSLIIQLACMVLATVLALLALGLSLGVSRRLRPMSAPPPHTLDTELRTL